MERRYRSAVINSLRNPLVFVDIDGVLIPLRARPLAVDRRWSGGAGGNADVHGNPLLDRLDPADGPRLLALPGELVWASTWMADANDVVVPRLGLPALPFVDWPDEPSPHGVHWKTAPLTRWAAGRPFVWLDDETTDADQQWITAHHSHPALLRHVDPHLGLTDHDLAVARQWLDHRGEAC